MIELLYHNQKGDKQIAADKEWKKQIKSLDIRDAVLRKLTGRNYSDVGIMVYFLKLGTYFCVFREFQSDRELDNHAIWIFIHKEEEMNPKDLSRLLTQVIDKVKCEPPYEEESIAMFSSDVEKLSNNYDVKPSKRPEFLSADNKKYACRYYDENNNLYDVLCDLYQPEYERYEAVLLLDKHSSLKGGPEVEDLTGHELKGQEVIDPSEVNKQLPQGVEAYYHGKPFRESAFIPKNGYIDLELRRKGFVTITFPYAKGQTIEKLEWKVRIDHSLFDVEVKNKGKSIKEFRLSVNGAVVNNSVDLTEFEAKQASFRIEKSGYEPCPFKKDNVNFIDYIISGRKILVELEKSDQEFIVRQKRFETVKVVVKTSQTIEEDETPLKGYYREGDALEYDSWSFLNHLLFWLLMGGALILGGVGGFYINKWLNSRSSKPKTELTNSPQTPPSNSGQNNQNTTTSPSNNGTPVTEEKDESRHNDAVNYLDGNEVWNKDDMEKISELKGFWDMLNQFDIDKIKSLEWHNKLMDSKNYKEIVDAYGDKKSSDYKNNKPRNRNNPQDLDITVKNYINEVKGLSGNHSSTTGGGNLNKGSQATQDKTNKVTNEQHEEAGPGENDL